ncbi:MAG TPA: rhomboid-like protein [Amycolatopsis sp.]|nr:rhomboid-like protein [Amycolatopsis sp.]
MHEETEPVRGNWAWTRRAVRLLPGPLSTPFTFWYLVVLLATTIVLRVVDDRVAHRLLALSSTDALNLWRRPFMSLVTSALWISDSGWIVYVLIFALAVAPLERRVGAAWTLAVFASGHVVATLVTELPVMWALNAGLLPRNDGHWLDIGVSYGFFTTAGAMLTVLAPKVRRWVVPATLLSIVVIYVTDEPGSLLSMVTLAGHLTAALIGLFAWRGWLRRRGLAGTLTFPGPRRGPQVPPPAALAGRPTP